MSNVDQFRNKKYLNLETYRKSGAPVLTPMWFAEQDDLIYVYSVADVGKVKRIRRNPNVRIAPCGLRGQLEGEWCDGVARIEDEEGAVLGNRLLNRKYGLLKRIGSLYSNLIGRKRVVISIRLNSF